MGAADGLYGKRILFLLAGLELGGAERQALHLARYLKRHGCDVRVWGHSGPGLAAKECDEAGIPWSIQPSCWPCRKRHLPRAIWRYFGIVKSLRRERPDLIISYCYRPCVNAGLAWRWSSAKAFVWGQRDCYLPGGTLERIAYRRASAIVCNASHEIDFLQGIFGKTSAPVSVVHNGLELAPPERTRAQWRAELNIRGESPVVTMVANFSKQKDHSTLLRGWRKLLDTHRAGTARDVPRLVLAGAEGGTLGEVRELARQLELAESVIFPGQVRDVAGLLEASDIGVLISPSEGMSNSVLEYMAAGLPVVATDHGANREALGDDAEMQLCRAGDINSFALRCEAFLGDGGLRSRVGHGNRVRAQTEFSIEKMCRRSASVICDLLGAPSALSPVPV